MHRFEANAVRCVLAVMLTLGSGNVWALTDVPPQTSANHWAVMPEEEAPHEGTWLQWPHQHTYGVRYRDRLDPIWVAMTRALVRSERVHIIAWDRVERNRIRELLQAADISLARVDFTLAPTDDVWVRDNGPIFVYDQDNQLAIADFAFNGWGLDAPHHRDNRIPQRLARRLGLRHIDLRDVVLEGGAIEVDGRGVLLATRSSILEPNRNPWLTEEDVNDVLAEWLGIGKVIWLDGAPGGDFDITDTHIDGFARFANGSTLVSMARPALRRWGLSSSDITRLRTATDINGQPYRQVVLPLTRHKVVTRYGYPIGARGTYLNYYVANTVVLVPTYADPHDAVALRRIQHLYPQREIIGIDVRNLYRYGGMVHCVTQQQPIALRAQP